MKTDNHPETRFLQTVTSAVARLKARLQNDYQRAYPQLSEIIHLVIDEEEANAWELSAFPHLLLPDLVEAHIAKLNLRPADTGRYDFFVPSTVVEVENLQPAFAI